MIYKTFVTLNAGYIDPAIVALTSYLRYNGTLGEVCLYVEAGTNCRQLRRALRGYPVEIREVELPQLPEHDGVQNKYGELFFKRSALPAFAQRIKALEELRNEADVIINIDLDTLTTGGIAPLLPRAERGVILGVSERRNRDRWIRGLGVRDIVQNPNYINTGFAIYGADAIPADIFRQYRDFLREHGPDLYCPEQDFINYALADRIVNIPEGYNLMYTSEAYTSAAPVMIHFLGSAKPWNPSPEHPARAAYYIRRYLREAERCRGLVSDEFLERVAEAARLA